MRTIGMSDYTVGEDCFDELSGALAEYGAKKVAIIGGKRALAAALPGIEAALAGTDVEILETRVYGTNSTRANIAKVVNSPACQEADVLIACGGGKALDTVKTAAIELKKIVFTVPTICSNCSAATAIAVVYNDDGSLEGYSYPNRPAHIFINPKIIAEAPAEYFWAGVGDALSKQPEVEYATSAGNLEHTAGLGLALAHTCSESLFTYGVQGLEDVRQNLSSEAVKQIALDIVVNTGYVSNLTNQNDYYYNSSVAHAFYNATCSIPREGTYLHGEVVSLGVLVLFAYTGDTENLERYAAFNKQMGLPVTLEQVGLSESDIPALCEYAHATNEWKQGNPEPFTDEKFAAAIKAATEELAKASHKLAEQLYQQQAPNGGAQQPGAGANPGAPAGAPPPLGTVPRPHPQRPDPRGGRAPPRGGWGVFQNNGNSVGRGWINFVRTFPPPLPKPHPLLFKDFYVYRIPVRGFPCWSFGPAERPGAGILWTGRIGRGADNV